MPDLLVETPEGVTLRYELAGAGSRAAAGMIDLLIFMAVWTSLALILGFASMQDPSGISAVLFGLLAGGALLLPAVYQMGFTLFWDGQTPGKHLLGLRVTDAGGYPARTMQLVLRALFWPLEAMLLVFPIPVALLLITVTERRQRLGDLVGGTVVLRDRAPAAETEPYPRETWSELPKRKLQLVPALATRLDAEDYRFLRSVMGRRDLDRRARSRLMRAAAQRYLEILGLEAEAPTSRESARETLKEIYLFLREARGIVPPPAPPPRRGRKGTAKKRAGRQGVRRATRRPPAGAAADRDSARAPGSRPR